MPDLCLCELEQEGDLGALGEGQVLRPLEPAQHNNATTQ